MFYHEKYPFMLADVDRMVVGENAGLECKTASPYMTEQWENGKIPLSYQIQCLHYMAVCNADAWYIAVLIYGREFKYYKMERDEEMIADLIRIEQNFWENHVLKEQSQVQMDLRLQTVLFQNVLNRLFQKRFL